MVLGDVKHRFSRQNDRLRLDIDLGPHSLCGPPGGGQLGARHPAGARGGGVASAGTAGGEGRGRLGRAERWERTVRALPSVPAKGSNTRQPLPC